MPDSDSRRDGGGNGITINVKDRIIAALLAALMGGGTTLGVLRYSPVAEEVVRPFPYTSIDAERDKREAKKEREAILQIVRETHDEIHVLIDRMARLEREHSKMEYYRETHEEEAKDGFARIRKCEQEIGRLKDRCDQARDDIRAIQADIQ